MIKIYFFYSFRKVYVATCQCIAMKPCCLREGVLSSHFRCFHNYLLVLLVVVVLHFVVLGIVLGDARVVVEPRCLWALLLLPPQPRHLPLEHGGPHSVIPDHESLGHSLR